MSAQEETAKPELGHYWAERAPTNRPDQLTALMNQRWEEGWRLEHMSSISWGAFIAQSSTWVLLVWVPREAA